MPRVVTIKQTDVKVLMPLVVTMLKGGPGSGFHGHAGRPGEVGGSLSEGGMAPNDIYEFQKKINIATYDKTLHIHNGDTLSDVMMSAPYDTREEFAKKFVDEHPVPRANKNAKQWDAEYFLYGIRETLREYGGNPSAIDGKDLERHTGLNGRDLDFSYSRNMREWISAEHTHGLYQFRVNSSRGYRFDRDNGIISVAETLNKAMREFGFRKPEKLYDYLMTLNKERKPIIVTKDSHSDTAMIAFDCTNDKQLSDIQSEIKGDSVKDLHITLLYLGEIIGKEVRQEIKEDIIDTLRSFSSKHAPITGKFNGYAIFNEPNDNNKLPIVLLYDSPGLPGFREALNQLFPFSEKDHGFMPHMTLAYISDTQSVDSEKINKTFDKICLYWSGEKIEFPLSGTLAYKSKKPIVILKGGVGSGNFQHHGRPGKVGGSAPIGTAWHNYNEPGYTKVYHGAPLSVLDDISKEGLKRSGIEWMGRKSSIYFVKNEEYAIYWMRYKIGSLIDYMPVNKKYKTYFAIVEFVIPDELDKDVKFDNWAAEDFTWTHSFRIEKDIPARYIQNIKLYKIVTVGLGTQNHFVGNYSREDIINMHGNILEELKSSEICYTVIMIIGDNEPIVVKAKNPPTVTASRKLQVEFGEVLGSKLPIVVKGGKGSGFHGHSGRPGEVGGSQSEGNGKVVSDGTGNKTDLGTLGVSVNSSREELEVAGFIAVYRGGGKRGMTAFRTNPGLLGDEVYFYTDPIAARSYATRGGGIATAYVHPFYSEFSNVPGREYQLVTSHSLGAIIRRGVVWEGDNISGDKWRQMSDDALNQIWEGYKHTKSIVITKGGKGSGFHGHPGGHIEGGKLKRGGSRSNGAAFIGAKPMSYYTDIVKKAPWHTHEAIYGNPPWKSRDIRSVVGENDPDLGLLMGIENEIRNVPRNYKMSFEEYQKEVEDELRKQLADCDVYMRMTPENLEEALREGTLENTFTSKKTGAEYRANKMSYKKYLEERINGESTTLGVPKDTSGEDRPIYGYWSKTGGINKHMDTWLDQYGSIAIQFNKSKIADSVTFTNTDSLDMLGRVRSSDWRNPSITSTWGLTNGTYMTDKIKEGPEGDTFWEAQIYNHSVSNIRMVTSRKPFSASLIKLLDEKGIPWEIVQ